MHFNRMFKQKKSLHSVAGVREYHVFLLFERGTSELFGRHPKSSLTIDRERPLFQTSYWNQYLNISFVA